MGAKPASRLQGSHQLMMRRWSALEQTDRQRILLLMAALVAIVAQAEIANRLYWLGIASFALALGCTVFGTSALPSVAFTQRPVQSLLASWRIWLLIPACLVGGLTFWASGGNRYRWENVVPWLVSIVLFGLAWAELPPGWWRVRLGDRWRKLTPRRIGVLLILLAILALGAAFRFVELRQIPRDMIMDHAEKLLDVNDVLQGIPHIFFERNTGREPWQFYWTVALIRLFHLPLDYMALKLGTALIGWLMLPAIFLLGRELFGTRTALLATLFAAVTSWSVLATRYGLRYPLAPCAVAWTMYFLVRGLRRDRRNSMIAAGIWLGIGLQGYTAFRFMLPVFGLLVGCWAMWQYWQRERAAAVRTLVTGGLALLLALLVMMPLMRYGIDHPDKLFYRASTRLTSLERQIPGSAPEILFNNIGNVLLMFNYTADDTWVVNLRFKPSVDSILGGLIVIGATGAIVIGIRRRDPWPIMLLGAGILMLIPSALSIAFPRENPSLVRTGGAIPMAMILCAIVPGMLLERARIQRIWLHIPTMALIGFLVSGTILINRERIFVEYPLGYCQNVLHSADMAHEMQAFIDAGNPRENVWFVARDGWVDYRAVGIELGQIQYQQVVVGPASAIGVDLHGKAGLFALNTNDDMTLLALMATYPHSTLRIMKVSDCNAHYLLLVIPASSPPRG